MSTDILINKHKNNIPKTQDIHKFRKKTLFLLFLFIMIFAFYDIVFFNKKYDTPH
jgi:hypothetical protein